MFVVMPLAVVYRRVSVSEGHDQQQQPHQSTTSNSGPPRAAVREAELCKTKGREGGNGVKAPDTKVPPAPTFKGGLSAAERLRVRAQRESAEKRKRMRRRQQNRRIFR